MKRAVIVISMALASACDQTGDLGDTGSGRAELDSGAIAEGDAGGDPEAEAGGDEPSESSSSGDGGEAEEGEAGDAPLPDAGAGEESGGTTGEPALCDPLLQDCADGDECVFEADAFHCLPDESGDTGNAGDACEAVNSCDPGTFCASAPEVTCPDGLETCCSSFCDLSEPGDVCGAGDCVPFFPDGEAPPGLESVGYCTATP